MSGCHFICLVASRNATVNWAANTRYLKRPGSSFDFAGADKSSTSQ